jgi:hypothetical protein
LACCAFAALAAIVSAYVLFPDGTTSIDDVAYESQALALGHGHATLSAATHDPSFRPFLSGVRDGHIVFKYEPVWPAFIAVSERATGSAVPMLALLAAAAVAAVYWFTWELLQSAVAAAVAAFVTVASPFVWVQSGTLLGYHFAFVAIAAAAAALLAAVRSTRLAVVAGLLCSLAAFHRPFDTLLALAPVVVYAGWRMVQGKTFGRRALAFVVGALPLAIVAAVYHAAVMGAPWRLPYSVSGPDDRFGFGTRASFAGTDGKPYSPIDFTVSTSLRAIRQSLTALPRFVFGAPIVAIAALWVLVTNRRDARAWLLTTMTAIIPIGYVFWWGPANITRFGQHLSLGPAYFYPMLLPLAAFAGWAVTRVHVSRPLAVAGIVVAVGWTLLAGATVLEHAVDVGNARQDEARAWAGNGRRLVLVPPRTPAYPYVRRANAPDLDGELVVGLDDPTRRALLAKQFPGRRIVIVDRRASLQP